MRARLLHHTGAGSELIMLCHAFYLLSLHRHCFEIKSVGEGPQIVGAVAVPGVLNSSSDMPEQASDVTAVNDTTVFHVVIPAKNKLVKANG
jgi:hypothetical protein